MPINLRSLLRALARASFILGWLVFVPGQVVAADRLIGLHSAQVMSQSMPWIGPAHSLRGYANRHLALQHRQARSGDRQIYARDGRVGEDSPHR